MDLCDGLGEAEFAPLPAPRRRGLEAALMRAEPATEPGPTSAVALGLMGVVRGLAAGGPVVIAVDDLQWLDRSSAEAVAFVAGRLAGARVGFLLALRRVPRGFLRRRSQGAGWSASRSDRCRLARCGGCCSSTSAFRPCAGKLPSGILHFRGHTGINHVRFQGRIPGANMLAPGNYTLTATAIGPTGVTSVARSLSFTIVNG